MNEPSDDIDVTHHKIATHILHVANAVKHLPPTRELSLAITKLEEAVHWISADAVKRGEDAVRP